MSNKDDTTNLAHDNGEALRDGSREPTNNDRLSTNFAAPTPTTHANEKRSNAHAHPHPHPHADDETKTDRAHDPGAFTHEKLDVCRVALEMLALANDLAKQIPRGHRNVADHLLRAASNTALLCAEGANRRGAALKRQRFVESRGECGEVAAAADLIVVLQIGNVAQSLKMKQLASRVSAMLTRLIARLG